MMSRPICGAGRKGGRAKGAARDTSLQAWESETELASSLAGRTMDPSALLKRLGEEASSCPICGGCFQDPVSAPCGHTFCQGCLESRSGSSSCSQCGKTSPRESGAANPQLARIAEILRGLDLEGLEGEPVCERHRELLKLFCQEDKIPICLVCDLSKEHRHHTVVPAEEATQDYKEQFQKELKMWKQRRKNLQALKEMEDRRSWKFLEKLGSERMKIVSEFEQLHQFLEDQEEVLLTRLKQLEKEVITEERTIMSKLSEEISKLSDLISEMEEKYKQPVNEFLQVRTWICSLRHRKRLQSLDRFFQTIMWGDREERLHLHSEFRKRLKPHQTNLRLGRDPRII
uniref:Zinc finger protein RFP-like isoform X1 n=2 Tax=Pogona vitticeps TaxID=103695 RepID=A0ABM5FIT6_9SAUR